MTYSIDRLVDVHEIWELENGELAMILERATDYKTKEPYVVFACRGEVYVESIDSFLAIKSSRSGLTHHYKNNKIIHPFIK
jgi:hypothetical protein